MAYYQFKSDNGDGYGCCEVFYASINDVKCYWACGPSDPGRGYANSAFSEPVDNPADLVGWYWQACYPGCLPDSDPIGPFQSESEAIDDANLVTD